MPVRQPQPVHRETAARFLDEGFILFSASESHVFWFGLVLTLSPAQLACWIVLWNNFFRGNLPIPYRRIVVGRGDSVAHPFHLFKRHAAWTEEIIVSDGKGNFWLRVPDDRDELFTRAGKLASI